MDESVRADIDPGATSEENPQAPADTPPTEETAFGEDPHEDGSSTAPRKEEEGSSSSGGEENEDAASAGKETPREQDTESGKGLIEKISATSVTILEKAEEVIDEGHSWFSGEVVSTALTVDTYFDNENASVEGNRTQIKMNLSIFYEKDGNPQPGAGLDIKLVLPRFQRRVHMVFSGDPESIADDISKGGLERPLPLISSSENSPKTAAVRYFLMALDAQSLNVDGGADIDGYDPVFFGMARYRLTIDTAPSLIRFTQWVKWYTDTGYTSVSRLEFERLFGADWFFRAGADLNWYEEEKENYFYSGKLDLYHTLSQISIMQYSVVVNCETYPENRITNTIVKALHRKNMWREWFYVEGALQASYPEERDFDVTPAVYFKIEMLFGHVPKLQG